MTKVPEFVFGSASFVRADEETEEDGEGAWPSFATKEGLGRGEKPGGGRPFEQRESRPNDWPTEARFRSQGLGSSDARWLVVVLVRGALSPAGPNRNRLERKRCVSGDHYKHQDTSTHKIRTLVVGKQ